jgi:hypothetical protein
MVQIVRSLEIRGLLDLGCGPAVLLTELARLDTGFAG